MHPKVSVCIPAYNSCEFIGKTIESVLKQTLSDFELIICDDASSDGTREVIRQYQDPRIRLIENQVNLGAEKNWSLATSFARAPYIKLLCGDDVLYPDCLARQVSMLDSPAHASAAMICCTRDIIDPDGKVIFARRGIHFDGIMSSSKAIRMLVRSGTNPIGEPLTTMYRKAVADKIGMFDNSLPYCIDIDYWMRLLMHGNLLVSSEPLGAFRISLRAASTTLRRQQWMDMYAFYCRLRKAWPQDVHLFDMALGVSRSFGMQYARRIVYRLYLRRNSKLKKGAPE